MRDEREAEDHERRRHEKVPGDDDDETERHRYRGTGQGNDGSARFPDGRVEHERPATTQHESARDAAQRHDVSGFVQAHPDPGTGAEPEGEDHARGAGTERDGKWK